MRVDMLKEQMEMILKGGRVARFHTKPVLKEETVAAHSYLVAWIVTVVSAPFTPKAEVLLACLAHDLPEFVLGDLPSPAKKSIPGLQEQFRRMETSLFRDHGLPDYEGDLSLSDALLVKFGDNMAGYLKCLYELQLGNSLLVNTAQRYHAYIRSSLDEPLHPQVMRCRAMLACFPLPMEPRNHD